MPRERLGARARIGDRRLEGVAVELALVTAGERGAVTWFAPASTAASIRAPAFAISLIVAETVFVATKACTSLVSL